MTHKYTTNDQISACFDDKMHNIVLQFTNEILELGLLSFKFFNLCLKNE